MRGRWGLIPARAGSTGTTKTAPSPPWAHPRPCGEHHSLQTRSVISKGSSPPVRGAPVASSSPRVWIGLIPARAGSTYRLAHQCSYRRAHPRPCGEHGFRDDGKPHVEGSSPPVRGARELPFAKISRPGLIPARAGSTTALNAAFKELGAHPRPCGEHPLP